MFEALLISALGIYTLNPCKSSCTFQVFFYFFLVYLHEHTAIACELFWPNLSTSNYTNFQEYPRKIYITEPSFILKKGYHVLVPKSSRKCIYCVSSRGGCFKTKEMEWDITEKHLMTVATFNISPAFLLIYPESFNLIRWRSKHLFPWSREHIIWNHMGNVS